VRTFERHFPIPAAAYALESVAAAFFYLAILLGVIGAIGLARASVEHWPRKDVPVMLVVSSFIAVGLAMICWIASPRHTLPF